jgi:hypothetical protein
MFRRNTHKRKKSNSLFLIIPALVLILFVYVFNFSSMFRTSMKVDWTGISQSIQDTLKDFVVFTDDYYVYEHNWKSITVEDRKIDWVLKNASQEELYNLTNHPHGMIKVLSYYKLMNSDYSNKFEMLKKAFSDSITFVYERSGCTGNEFLLSEFLNEQLFLDDGISRPPLPHNDHSNLGLSTNEIIVLTEMLKFQIENKRKYIKMFYSDISDEK